MRDSNIPDAFIQRVKEILLSLSEEEHEIYTEVTTFITEAWPGARKPALKALKAAVAILEIAMAVPGGEDHNEH